jgi:hypothetical protein
MNPPNVVPSTVVWAPSQPAAWGHTFLYCISVPTEDETRTAFELDASPESPLPPAYERTMDCVERPLPHRAEMSESTQADAADGRTVEGGG